MKKLLTLSLLCLSFTACTGTTDDTISADALKNCPENPRARWCRPDLGSASADLAQPSSPADLAPPSLPPDLAQPSSPPDLARPADLAAADLAKPSSPTDLATPPSPLDMSSGSTGAPQVTIVSPQGGPLGTAITVSGAGFQAGDTVQISGSNLAAITLTTLSLSSSAISATIPTVGVPAPSQLTVSVVRGTTRSAGLSFRVTSGKVYYLSPTGNDSASGSISTPWRTLNGAASHLQPGDLVYLRGGTYWGTGSLRISGTATAPIVFEGYPGERAVINNPSSNNNNDTVSVYGSYLIFDHLAFSDQHNPGNALSVALGANHNVVSNCEFFGAQGQGLILTGDYNLIVNNSIHDNGVHVAHDHGIYLEGANNIIRGNVIYNNLTFGIQLYNGYGRISGGNLIEKNYIYHNGYGSTALGFKYNAGIILSTGQPNTIVRYNILCDNAQYALYGLDSVVTGNQVISNVSCGNQSGGFFFDLLGSGTTLNGNISYNDQGFSVGLNTPVTSDYNYFYKAGSSPMMMYNWSTMTLASFRSATGQDLHSQIVDPKFTAGPVNGFDWTRPASYNFCTTLIPALCSP